MSDEFNVRARVKHAQSQCVYFRDDEVKDIDLVTLTRSDVNELSRVTLAHTCRICQNDAVNVVYHERERYFYEYFTCSACLKTHKKNLSAAYTASANFLDDAINVTAVYLDAKNNVTSVEKSVQAVSSAYYDTHKSEFKVRK